MLDRPEATIAMYRRGPKLHELQPILLPSMPNFEYRDWVRAGCPPESDPNAKFNDQPPSDQMSVEISDEALQNASTTSSAPSLLNLDDFVASGMNSSAFDLLGKTSFLYNPADDTYCKVNLDNRTSLLPRSPSKKFVCPRNPSRAFKKPDSFIKPIARKGFSFLNKKSPDAIRPPAAFENSPLYVPQVPNPSNNYINPCLL